MLRPRPRPSSMTLRQDLDRALEYIGELERDKVAAQAREAEDRAKVVAVELENAQLRAQVALLSSPSTSRYRWRLVVDGKEEGGSRPWELVKVRTALDVARSPWTDHYCPSHRSLLVLL